MANNFRRIIVIGLVLAIGIGTWYYYFSKPPNAEPERADLVMLNPAEVK